MKVITIANTFGNFDYEVSAQVTPETETALLQAGITQLFQRVPCSRIEKALAGYAKRPDGFTRSSIEFSEENAIAFAEAAGATVSVEVGRDEKGKAIELEIPLSVVDVREHVVEEKDGKFTEEKAIIARHQKDGDFAEWVKTLVKFFGPTNNNEGWTVEFLRAVRARKLAILREATKTA